MATALMRVQPLALAGMFVAQSQSPPRASFPTNALVPEPPPGSRVPLKAAEPEKRPAT